MLIYFWPQNVNVQDGKWCKCRTIRCKWNNLECKELKKPPGLHCFVPGDISIKGDVETKTELWVNIWLVMTRWLKKQRVADLDSLYIYDLQQVQLLQLHSCLAIDDLDIWEHVLRVSSVITSGNNLLFHFPPQNGQNSNYCNESINYILWIYLCF